MRVLMLLVVMIVALVGPFYYFTAGAKARDARLEELERIQLQRAAVENLLASDEPTPTTEETERQVARVRAAEAEIDTFVDRILGPSRSEPPSREDLISLGNQVRIDATILNPIVSILTDDASDRARRQALAALLRALNSGVTVEELSITRTIRPHEVVPRLGFVALEVQLLGSSAEVVQCYERLVAGSPSDPPADVDRLDIGTLDAAGWDRPGLAADAPPIRMHLRVNLLVEGSRSR